jgi:hypothetical protein
MTKHKFLFTFTIFFLSLLTNIVQAQGVSVVTSNPLLIDTTSLDLKEVQEKYKDMSGEEIGKFKQFDNSSGIDRGDLTGGVGEEETGNYGR